MRDTDLYTQILGLHLPWQVSAVELDRPGRQVTVKVTAAEGSFVCPRCGEQCPGYDKRVQRWRHLDTMQYHTILEAEVPRVQCGEHGVLTIDVP